MQEATLIFREGIELFDCDSEPASAQQIAEAERDLGVSFPAALRRLLGEFGRCGFRGDARIVVDGGELGIFTFFGLSGDSSNIVEDWKAHDDFQKRRLVPIADDMFNNRYVLNADGGEVIFIDYSSQSSAVVATTFDDFLSMIEVVPFED